MKMYIRPMIFWEEIEVRTSLLSSSKPEGAEVPGVMAKKNDFTFIDDDVEEDTSWSNSKSVWEN